MFELGIKICYIKNGGIRIFTSVNFDIIGYF